MWLSLFLFNLGKNVLMVEVNISLSCKMSAYGHQMEQEYPTHGLPSEDGFDMGSQFGMESMIYMSSCVTTVFVSALVIVGVLLMTLRTTLTLMLQSFHSREAGVVESIKSDHHHHREP